MFPSRYHRQSLLPGWGHEGQARLANAHAVIVGVGALGCVSADMLARAGVGRITLIDRDVVEHTNLQRQTLFDERDAHEATPKAEAARRRLASVNSEIDLRAVVADVDAVSAERLVVADARTIIIDGLDNFETRFLLNDIAVKHALPYIHAGAVALRGTVMPVLPAMPGAPCLRCLFKGPPAPGREPTCDTAGVLGPLIAIVAGHQAALALRALLGLLNDDDLRLLETALWPAVTRDVALAGARDPDCPCCARRSFEFLHAPHASGAASLCGRDAVQVTPSPGSVVDLDALAERLGRVGEFTRTRFHLRGRLSEGGHALTVFPDGRALIHGVTDPARAKAIYARYIGL